MIFPALTWVLLLVSLALCVVGFYKFTWFTTVGHGVAVTGLVLGCAVIALSRGKSSPAFWLSCIFGLLYGLLQGGFTVLAEFLQTRRRQALKSQRENNTPWYIYLAFWILTALVFVLEISPLWYRAASGVGKDSVFSWIAVFFMGAGLVLIFLSRRQAGIQRQEDSRIPPMQGVYSLARCPSQLGQILFWTGMLISAFTYVSGAQWIPVILGTASALFLAIRSAQRQDKLFRRRYSYLPEYREYAEDTHILVPLMMSKPIRWE